VSAGEVAGGEQVQKDVAEHGHGAGAAIARNAVPEDASPDLSFADPVTKACEHIKLKVRRSMFAEAHAGFFEL
jgi:hypothetical protein